MKHGPSLVTINAPAVCVHKANPVMQSIAIWMSQLCMCLSRHRELLLICSPLLLQLSPPSSAVMACRHTCWGQMQAEQQQWQPLRRCNWSCKPTLLGQWPLCREPAGLMHHCCCLLLLYMLSRCTFCCQMYECWSLAEAIFLAMGKAGTSIACHQMHWCMLGTLLKCHVAGGGHMLVLAACHMIAFAAG